MLPNSSSLNNHFMKRIVFLSTMAFDANVSIIKRLRSRYDVYFVYMANEGISKVGFWSSAKDVNRGDEISAMSIIRDYVDLNKTFIIKHPVGLSFKKISVELKVLNLVRNIKPDVILTDCAMLSMYLARMVYRKKCISLIHDPFPHSGEETFNRKLSNKLLIKWGQAYVLFNESQRQKFADAYAISQDKIFSSFLSQYEFLTLFQPNKDILPKENKKLKVLFTGRISPYKGLCYLYEAVQSYLDTSKDIQLVIAGKGSIDFDISGVDDEHIFIHNRFIESGELHALLDWCDVVVCPYTDATQSGVIMSAFALCKPVLGTNVGGLPEMLGFGRYGYIVPAKDSKALCEALRHIALHPEELATFSQHIHEDYFNHGEKSWEKAAEIISKAIESI